MSMQLEKYHHIIKDSGISLDLQIYWSKNKVKDKVNPYYWTKVRLLRKINSS